MISILIVNWNTRERLQACLESIQATCRELDTETLVVDNASEDGSAAMVRQQFPWVRLIVSQENLGFGRANNLGCKKSVGKYLLLLNPDTLLYPGTVACLLKYLNEHPAVGLVGPELINADGTLQVSAQPSPNLVREAWRIFHLDQIMPVSCYPKRYFQAHTAQSADVLMGACMLVRREVIDQVGLFDEQFFMYSEEVDLCIRIRRAGWKIDWVPNALVLHYGGASTRQVPDQMFIELYRNKVKLFRKWHGTIGAGAYKALLLLGAFPRVLLTPVLRSGLLRRKNMSIISHQYQLLLKELPGF